jgi:membrane associated rhomboid family serine protease
MSLAAIAIMVAGLIITYWRKLLLTHTLIIVNVIVFMLSTIEPNVYYDLRLNPNYILGGERLYTIVTSMHLHLDVIHLIFNMLFFIFFGLLFEEKVGTLRFGIIFYLSGIMASLMFAIIMGVFRPYYVAVGASGGLAGILGAYGRLFPDDKFAFFPFPQALPIQTWASMFFVISLVIGFLQVGIPTMSNEACCLLRVAHLAHLGGLMTGFMIAPYVMRVPSKEKKKMAKFDFSALEALAVTDEDKALLAQIKSEDEPEVRDAWIEHFLKKARCPNCSGMLDIKGRSLKCTCGFEVKF